MELIRFQKVLSRTPVRVEAGRSRAEEATTSEHTSSRVHVHDTGTPHSSMIKVSHMGQAGHRDTGN